ncbi:MAG: class I tRNA ligase family protein [Candidatus Nitrosocosmicus sp.]
MVKLHAKLRIFICGPTLYEKCHIGHARIFIFFNFLINFHRFVGDLPVAILQLTDIDHKIYQKSSNSNHKIEKIANLPDKYLIYLFRDLENLQIEHNFIYSRVSDFLSLIKNDVVDILRTKRGYSYAGNVYLTIEDPIVGSLGLTSDEIDDMPIDISSGTKNQRDILIWNSENFYQEYKKTDCNGENNDTILTTGIPGWHFQDHEIIKNVFSAKYDIHGGARELLYPHHEFIDELFITNNSDVGNLNRNNNWVHVGLVNFDSQKMSNSSGNTVSISDVLKRYSPNALKIFFLSKNYKDDVEFSIEDLDRADIVDKIISGFLLKKDNNHHQYNYLEKDYLRQFLKFMRDDYDTESSISLILRIIDKHHNPVLIESMVGILGLKYY